jgi:hypothetical protein
MKWNEIEEIIGEEGLTTAKTLLENSRRLG